MYAACASDLDKRNLEANKRLGRVMILFQKLGEGTSFAEPEILALGPAKVAEFFRNHKEYQGLDFAYVKLFHNQKYVLDGKTEEILSNYNPLLRGPRSLYSTLSTADRINSKVTLDNGEEVEVNTSNWTGLMASSHSAAGRERIFDALYKNFEPSFVAKYNKVPWRQIKGMRDKVAHGYGTIDMDRVWNTALKDIDPLLGYCKQILEENS